MLRTALVVIAALGVAFVLACIAGRRVMFPAPAAPPESQLALAAYVQRIWLDTPRARCEAFLLAADRRTGPAAPLVIFAHGNGELIDYWIDQFEPLRNAGVSILLVEYPGYGRSSGSPSQTTIAQAMVAAFDWAAAQPDFDRARIVGWGRSVGGGAICALARERPLAALVLESSFTSARAMASDLFGFLSVLVRDPFENLEVVRGFTGRVLVLHGERDEMIPVEHAHELHAAAARSELHLLPCGHNDCVRPWPVLERFLLAP